MSDPQIPPQPETPIASIPPAPLTYTVFRGPNGIRAGWRAAIFIVLVFAVGLVAALLFALVFYFAHSANRVKFGDAISGLTPLGLGFQEGTLFFCTAIAALIMSRIERRKFGEYGLPVRVAFQKDFWIGSVVGFAAISAALLGIFAFHGFRLTGVAIHGTTLVAATAAWTLAFVLVGLAEEFSFRGYLQFTLTTGMGFWPSAILLSALFGLAHAGNPGESKSGLLSVVLFGLLFCLFLRRRGSLWWAVGFHAGWDWGQTFFYGVPDSGIQAYHNLFDSALHGPNWLTGGTVGPEASIFTPIVLAMVAIIFSRVYRRKQTSALGL